MTSYLHSLVTVALSRLFFEIVMTKSFGLNPQGCYGYF